MSQLRNKILQYGDTNYTLGFIHGSLFGFSLTTLTLILLDRYR